MNVVCRYNALLYGKKVSELIDMTCWNKAELENMLEDVVDELDLSDDMLEEHGPLGTPPAEMVRLILDRKDLAGRSTCT